MNQISSFDSGTAPPRRPLRPLHGIPERDRRGAVGFVLSSFLHLLVLLMLVLPALLARQLNLPLESGGGGPGPPGGGGGGTGGSGGAEVVRTERLRYLQVTPTASAAPNTPVVAPVKLEKLPDPVVEKPPEPVPEPVVTVPPPAPGTVTVGVAVAVLGRGGGSGNDGTAGNGPGTGGGIGSGIGTGRGSGVGPGTGGGDGDIFPPQVTNLAILPIPVPPKVRPYKLVAYFDVDERGNARLISFNPSRDGGYNRRIREMLAEVRFRPAVRQDGTAVRDTAWITAEAPR